MPGRKRGGHNRGYWFRTGRGWYITLPGGKSMPLRDPEGRHIRDRHAPQDLLRQSYAQWLVHHGNGQKLPDKEHLTTVDICRYFLAHLKQSAKPAGFKMRAQMLFDFCTGYPGNLHGKKQVLSDVRRIHPGFGKIPVMQLTPRHVEEWLVAHPRWGASTRAIAIASLKRALNYAVKAKLLGGNPLREVGMPKYRARVTYFSPEEEEVLRANGHPRFAEALWVCIRTGVRPGEFCRLSSEHVEETPRGQRWRFPAEQTKTKRERIVFVPDEVAQVVRQRTPEVPKGTPIFRTARGKPWTARRLEDTFSRVRSKLRQQGIELPKDSCFYSCRHTFAKRMLGGYWGGKPCTIEQLAGLMGNTPKICWEHYAKWCEAYTDPLWDAVNPRGVAEYRLPNPGITAVREGHDGAKDRGAPGRKSS